MDEALKLYLDVKFDGITEHIKDIKGAADKHDTRIAALEKKVWAITGGLSLASTISASSFIYVLVNR